MGTKNRVGVVVLGSFIDGSIVQYKEREFCYFSGAQESTQSLKIRALWARNRVGKGLSYWPAKLHRLAESIPWNRFKSLNITSLIS
jgi:hypothetical protein